MRRIVQRSPIPSSAANTPRRPKQSASIGVMENPQQTKQTKRGDGTQPNKKPIQFGERHQQAISD